MRGWVWTSSPTCPPPPPSRPDRGQDRARTPAGPPLRQSGPLVAAAGCWRPGRFVSMDSRPQASKTSAGTPAGPSHRLPPPRLPPAAPCGDRPGPGTGRAGRLALWLCRSHASARPLQLPTKRASLPRSWSWLLLVRQGAGRFRTRCQPSAVSRTASRARCPRSRTLQTRPPRSARVVVPAVATPIQHRRRCDPPHNRCCSSP